MRNLILVILTLALLVACESPSSRKADVVLMQEKVVVLSGATGIYQVNQRTYIYTVDRLSKGVKAHAYSCCLYGIGDTIFVKTVNIMD